MYDADMEIEGAAPEDQTGGQDSKIFQKDVEKIDPFFQEAEEVAGAEVEIDVGEKRAVLRDGRVPKLEKNYKRQQNEQKAMAEGWFKEDKMHQKAKRPIPEKWVEKNVNLANPNDKKGP